MNRRVFISCALLCVPMIAETAKKPPAKIDINNATQVQLEKLPGITRLLAKKIVANRPYEVVDDLKRAGVPPETIGKIRPLVTVEQSMPANHAIRPVMGKPKK